MSDDHYTNDLKKPNGFARAKRLRKKLKTAEEELARLKNVVKLADQVVCASTFAPQWRMYVTAAPEMEAWRKVLAEEKLYECE